MSPSKIVKSKQSYGNGGHRRALSCMTWRILVPRGRAPFRQHQESAAKSWAKSNRFLVLTKRSAASGDENGRGVQICVRSKHAQKRLAWTSLKTCYMYENKVHWMGISGNQLTINGVFIKWNYSKRWDNSNDLSTHLFFEASFPFRFSFLFSFLVCR